MHGRFDAIFRGQSCIRELDGILPHFGLEKSSDASLVDGTSLAVSASATSLAYSPEGRRSHELQYDRIEDPSVAPMLGGFVQDGDAAHMPHRMLDGSGVIAVVAGTASERPLAASLIEGSLTARNIAGETSLVDLVTVAKRARFAVGNDNGTMHITAFAGIPSVVLYSDASDPALCAPCPLTGATRSTCALTRSCASAPRL